MESSNDLDTCPPAAGVEGKRQIEYVETTASIWGYDDGTTRTGATMRSALLALALLSAGCSHAVRSGPPEPRPQTTLKVDNQNFLDMVVYVLRAGQRIRLGTVTGLSSQVFTIPPDIVRSSPQLQFELHPIGGRGNPRSETISVQPGDEVVLTIPPL
ncbi:MAG: hypothetical protein AUI63_00710 [Gemmatimonadetes bacterium 13_1_40CM_2_60_3]|nr:MAG: hypothetical protein AUI63_00710 [Gemmatimonadetes bacterium 13_1_40CM_2_60_3]